MAARETVLVAQPIASAGGRVIASPFQFYTTGEDRLRVVSLNAVAGVTLKIHSRFVDRAGSVQANAEAHTPNSNRTPNTTEHELGAGALLNLTVFAGVGSPKIGQTFVIVQLIRGSGAAAIVLGTLLQGYVTAQQHLAWPGSPVQSSLDGRGCVRSYQGTLPAAGAEINELVPFGARWRIQSILLSFVTSAVVGTRYPAIRVFASAVQSVEVMTILGIQQSSGASITVAPGLPHDSGGPVTYQQLIPLPTDLTLNAGDGFTTATFGLLAGDQYANPEVTIEEWLMGA